MAVQSVTNLNIVGVCRIKKVDYSQDVPRFETIVLSCHDTPRHIANAVSKFGIKSYWVFRPGGEKTLETVKNGLSVKM